MLLRTRFLLILLLGAVVPLGLVGWWLTRTTLRSGEELLRTRLSQTLDEIVQTIGRNWVSRRSELLRLAETSAVQAALAERRQVLSAANDERLGELEQRWAAVAEAVERVTLYDLDGEIQGTLPAADRPALGSATGFASSVLPLQMAVYDYGSDGRIGTMEVRLRTSSLLPSDLVLPGLGGSVLALFDATGTTPLLPLTIERDLLARDRFAWAGETWLAVRHTLYEPPLLVTLSAPLGALGQPFETAARRGAIALLAVALSAVVVATLATRRITRPLERLADGAGAVAQGELELAVAEDGPDEIRRVARAFNTMTVSLRQTLRELSRRESLAAVGEFAASLAHEVRNPLTAIRLDLQRAREHLSDGERSSALVDHALHEVARLDASVTGGLRLARSGQPSLTPLDLRQPLEAAYHAAEPRFNASGAVLEPLVLPTDPVWTKGDAGALEQLFLNILLNAAEASGAGMRAGVEFERADGTVHVSIWDRGKGIAPEQMDRIFEPFYSTSPEGTGLGLPIARRIARAHGGELEIESRPGGGTTARITLRSTAKPAADQA
ncbi:MAG: ATP-binding protein [Gemmatimonadales bacterium]